MVDPHIVFYRVSEFGVLVIAEVIKEYTGAGAEASVHNRQLPVFFIVYLSPAG